MTLQLNGQSEQRYREFHGAVVDQMPLLVSGRNEQGEVVDVPRDPASFAYVLERRMEAPQDVIGAWRNHSVFTGDTVSCGVDGDFVSTWDSPILRTVTPENRLVNGALELSTAQWNELRAQRDGTLYLSADEVEEFGLNDGRGYVKKDGVWTPENTGVEKVWEHLSRGRDLKEYVEMVADATPGSERIMRVYLDRPRLRSPTLREWVANKVDCSSNAYGFFSLDGDGHLVGVAPELSEGAKSRTK